VTAALAVCISRRSACRPQNDVTGDQRGQIVAGHNLADDAAQSEPPRSFRRLHLVRGRWSRGTSSNELSAGTA
jgi:hypothetical protein